MSNPTKEKRETITGALGIEEGWYENAIQEIADNWGELPTISDTIEWAAKETRDNELGVVNTDLTVYEKKLVMVGFIIGQRISQIPSNPFEALFLEFLKSQRGNSEDEE